MCWDFPGYFRGVYHLWRILACLGTSQDTLKLWDSGYHNCTLYPEMSWDFPGYLGLRILCTFILPCKKYMYSYMDM